MTTDRLELNVEELVVICVSVISEIVVSGFVYMQNSLGIVARSLWYSIYQYIRYCIINRYA